MSKRSSEKGVEVLEKETVVRASKRGKVEKEKDNNFITTDEPIHVFQLHQKVLVAYNKIVALSLSQTYYYFSR